MALRVAGTVALAAAAHQLATGVHGVRGGRVDGAADIRNLDSELRFYAAWYAVAGVLMHRAAADRSLDAQLGPAVAGGWALAAAGRLIGMRAVGRPDPAFLALTAAEAALAVLLTATRPARSRGA